MLAHIYVHTCKCISSLYILSILSSGKSLPSLFFLFLYFSLSSTDKKQTEPFSHTLDWHTRCKLGWTSWNQFDWFSRPQLSPLTNCPAENVLQAYTQTVQVKGTMYLQSSIYGNENHTVLQRLTCKFNSSMISLQIESKH